MELKHLKVNLCWKQQMAKLLPPKGPFSSCTGAFDHITLAHILYNTVCYLRSIKTIVLLYTLKEEMQESFMDIIYVHTMLYSLYVLDCVL